MRSIVFEKFGHPAEVLEVRETSLPTVPTGFVRVRMRLAPVNPSDLLTVRGQYGRLPKLPATPGYEGMGVVEEIHGGGLLARLRGLRVGGRVAVIHGSGGTWQEQVTIPWRLAIPVPNDLPDEQAASFFVNPATALLLLQHELQVRRGDTLAQSAANSSLGRMIIRLAKHLGVQTINLVRRPEQREELLHLGADHVLVVDAQTPDRIRELTQGRGAAHALDAVGGETGAQLVASLAPRGTLIVYGTLSGIPIPLDPRQLMTGARTIRGFWLSEWSKRQNALTMLRLFRRITRWMRQGVLTNPVAGIFDPDQLAEAIRLAENPGRTGKVLLRFGT